MSARSNIVARSRIAPGPNAPRRRVMVAAAPADRVRALDDALVSLSLSKSSADVQRLYVAVQQLRDTMTGR